MKKLCLIVIVTLVTSLYAFAQSPQSFNYQAIARNAAGNVLVNQSVSFRISLLQGSVTGTSVYSETHTDTTNIFGLVNIAIGSGTVASGSFAAINWANGPYFVKVELDATGGSNYAEMGTSQLLSVPYALYAKTSGSSYSLNNSNYISITVPADNFVNIQGTISLTANYTGLNSTRLMIEGGTITGNGTYILNIGYDCVVNGTTFNNVDIDCNRVTFINCAFTGNCARLGNNSKFYDCEFTSLTVGYSYLFGPAFNSELQNCTIPRASEFLNSKLINCIIGNETNSNRAISNISGCFLSGTIVYALQSDFTFNNNRCSNSKIKIGDALGTAQNVIVSNNQFWNIMSGTNEVIEIDPQSIGYKIFTIIDNSFLMQSSNPSSISITSNDGNTFGNSLMNIQGNTFWRGVSILTYSSNMKINYSQNIAFSVSNPASSGNLFANNNYSY